MKNKRLKSLLGFALALVMLGQASGVVLAGSDAAEGFAAAGAVPVASICLKENWRVHLDQDNVGEQEEWFCGLPGEGAVVSLPHNAANEGSSAIVWFSNTFAADLSLVAGQRALATLEGIRYYAKVWLNGSYLGDHEGSTGRFTFDVTGLIRDGQENLLAIQVFSPVGTAQIRGLDRTVLPTTFADNQFIQTPVYISVVPEVAIADTYAYADYDNGKVDVQVTIDNPTEKTREVAIATTLSAGDGGPVLVSTGKTVSAPSGLSSHTVSLALEDFRAWSPDDPYLYSVGVRVRAQDSAFTDSTALNIGFKKLFVDDEGYFVLNGERFFLKSLHTGPLIVNTQNSTNVGADIEAQLGQLDYYKAAGYNAVRFIAGPALPEMLDYCDKIGLLVYEEQGYAWRRGGSDETEQIMAREIRQLLERDRSHASFAMLGVLNETHDSAENRYNEVLAAAKTMLETIRTYDNNILVMFSSGRWDYDISQASASNPGSLTWNAYMGDEGSTDASVGSTFFQGLGDIHYYPNMPYNYAIRENFASIGGQRAAILSEGGHGSQPNIIASARLKQQMRQGGYSVPGWLNTQISSFEAYYNQFNMSTVYPTPEAFIEYTQQISAGQRALIFDYVRSNGKINGYSMTQGMDVNLTGEGVLEDTVSYKNGLFDSLVDGWSDLRFCLNIDHYNVYSDQTLDIDTYLSNFNVLGDGEYTVLFRITGAEGTVWTREATVGRRQTASGKNLTAVPVLKESIPLTGLAGGEYQLSAELKGTSVHSVKTFWVSDRDTMPRLSGVIYQDGLEDNAKALLEKQGLTLKDFDYMNIEPGCVVLLAGQNMENRALQALYESVNTHGTKVIGLSPKAFGDWGYSNLPFGNQIGYVNCNNWLYHFESFICDTVITEGLQGNGIVDPLYYEDVYPTHYFTNLPTASQMHVLTVFLGNSGTTTTAAMRFGSQIATYDYGRGHILLNTFTIVESIGTPAADRLLLNFVNYSLNVR